MSEKIPVTSIGIITAQNPFGAKLSYNINYDLNRKLRLELHEANFQMMPMEGNYAGHQENVFLAANIPVGKLMELGHKYKQKSVIWAFVRKDDSLLHFQYLEDGKIVTGKIVPIPPSYLESADDLFEAIRTGSFKLPVLEKKEEPKSDGSENVWESD